MAKDGGPKGRTITGSEVASDHSIAARSNEARACTQIATAMPIAPSASSAAASPRRLGKPTGSGYQSPRNRAQFRLTIGRSLSQTRFFDGSGVAPQLEIEPANRRSDGKSRQRQKSDS